MPDQTQSTTPPSMAEETQGKSLGGTAVKSEPDASPKTAHSKNKLKSDTKSSSDNHAGFASDIHAYLRGYIQVADQKAAFLFAAVGTMLAYLHNKGITKLWMKNPNGWTASETLAFIAIIGLLIGAFAAFIVIVPRFKGSQRGIIFWNAITLFDNKREYVEHIQAANPTALTTAKLEHCFELAHICKRKYRAVAVGLWCGGIGLLSAILYLAIF